MTARLSRPVLPLVLLVLVGMGSGGCELFTFSREARERGIKLYNEGNFTDAAGSFQNAVRQRPTDYLSHFWLGRTYERLGQNQRAIQSYKAARDIRLETMDGIRDVETREAIFDGLARTIAASAERDLEIQRLRERAAVARDGDDLIVLARVYRAAGDADNAIVAYQEAVERFPRDQRYALEFGTYLRDLGFRERARQVLTDAARVRPNPDIDALLRTL